MPKLFLLFAALQIVTFAAAARAQQPLNAPRLFENPPELSPAPTLRAPGLRTLSLQPAGTPQTEVTYNLNVAFSNDATIDNPSTGTPDKVLLRTYNGNLTAPTLAVTPGQTVRLRLHNKLPAESEADCPPPNGRSHILPTCFSITNMHFHGLHVSPAGNSDNVLLEIGPGQNFEYEVNVPADHPAGTFWYHAHRHGSTALQVSSGMVGALIIRGHRSVAQRDLRGGFADIDTVLRRADNQAPLAENVMLFQQIAYACFAPNSATPLTTTLPGGGTVWSCPPGQEGIVQYYPTQFGPPSWPASGHYTMITGQMQPRFGNWGGAGTPIRAGEIQRWRMIHGGVRDTINVQLVKAVGLADDGSAQSAAPDPQLGAQGQLDWVAQHCGADAVTVPQWEFAVDGLTRRSATVKPNNFLQPGYRSDVLVAFPQAGIYCILDQAAPATALVNPRPEGKSRRLLGLVRVQGGTPVAGDLAGYIQQQLQAANPGLPADVAQQLGGGDLSVFTPSSELPTDQIAQTRHVAFNIVLPPGNPPNIPARFEINDSIYNPARVDFTAQLGTIEDWDVTSKLAGHVFHIHVNPFQIVDIKNAANASIFGADGSCSEPQNDREYCDLKNVTRDTLFIKQGYHAILRTAYVRYIGEYVMHCHILDHEDQGMMLNVAVVPEGANALDSGALAATTGHGQH
ncbi:MAG TPA: multicopper oxidase domain-containing protein [Rhodopseudomonas sp.]|uniref:multicopper oxidase family protein n=1 Tax=Rhodopseudomonas sp. TaxID=1078 RepID=UPI002ED8B6BB